MNASMNAFPVLLLLSLWFGAAGASAQTTEILAGPYLQDPTASSIWVCWETQDVSDPTASTVFYGETTALGQSAQGQANLSTAGGIIHKVHLTGLSHTSDYFYQIQTGDYTSRSTVSGRKTNPIRKRHGAS